MRSSMPGPRKRQVTVRYTRPASSSRSPTTGGRRGGGNGGGTGCSGCASASRCTAGSS